MSQQVPPFYQGRPMTVPSVETSSSNLAPYNEWLQVCQRQDEFPFFMPAKTQAHWGTRPAVSEPRTQTYAADALPNLGPPREFGTAEQESYRNASKWNLIDLSRTAVSSVNVDQGLQHVSSRDVSLLRRALSDMGPRRRFLPYTVPMRKRHQGSSRVESGQQNYTQIQSPDDLHSHAFRCKGERAVLQSQKSTSGQSVHMHQKANGHNIVINKLQDNLPDPTALQSYSYFPSSLTDAGNSVVYPSSPPCPKPSKSAHMQEPVPLPDTIADIAESVITKLCVVFNKVEHYRRLLSCGTSDAQKLLDAFQMLLDTKWFHNRTQLIAAMRRLSEQEKLYPTCFSLSGPSPSLEDGPVASGSFADIYKIRFQGEQTCYKVIRVYQKSQVEHLAKVYAREAILWGQLSHPNILPFYGLLRFGPRIAFVSRWATNGNLEEYLAHNPDVNRILLCLDTAAGVEYLHNNDIVHGDLKGLNVLIDGSGRACLGDFLEYQA
ncbi:hypothetical protein H2248_008197 [Termitomyces sp. 'cryptogamus']|nr:hypothetical protein H2248_008197 [Termitomyces sp. 'cryptogamus']